MIFSPQGLLNANSRMPAERSGGPGPADAPAKSGEAGPGAEGADFLNLLARAARTGSAKSAAPGPAGSKQTLAGAEEFKEQLLDFLQSNLPEDVFQAGKAALGEAFSGNTKKSDLLESLQARAGGMFGLLQGLAHAFQNTAGPLGDAANGEGPDKMHGLRALLAAAANPETGVSGKFSALNRAGFDAADADETAAGHIRRPGAGEGNVRARGADIAEADALGRLRAFLTGVGEKVPGAAEEALSGKKGHLNRQESGFRDAKGDAAAQFRETAHTSHADRLFKAADPRDIAARNAIPAEGAKGGKDTGPADLRQILAAAGTEKDPDGIKAVLSGTKEGFQNTAKAAPHITQHITQPGIKTLSADQPGQETLENARIASGGGESFRVSTISMRSSSGSFERQIQVDENRLFNQISLRLSTGIRQGARSMTINMHPPELGSVKVRIVSEGSNLQVHLHSQNQQVAGIIERHLPGLHQSLMDQGVSVTDLQVSVDSGDDQDGSQFEEQGFGNPGRRAAAGESADEDEAPGAAADPEPVMASRGRARGLSLRV